VLNLALFFGLAALLLFPGGPLARSWRSLGSDLFEPPQRLQPETLQLLVDEEHRFGDHIYARMERLDLNMRVTNAFLNSLQSLFDPIEARVDLLESRIEAADQRIETGIDSSEAAVESAEQLLIRHEITLPRHRRAVKSF